MSEPREPLPPPDCYQITGESFTPDTVNENFQRLQDFLSPFGDAGVAPGPQVLARFLGGQLLRGDVSASTAADASGDTAFDHELGRVPTAILLSIPEDGQAGMIQAVPGGNLGASGANHQPWTRQQVFVRASVTGQYAFIVL